MNVGEKIQGILTDAESPNHVVLAELPNEEIGGFSLAKGDQDGLVSLLVLFFINYPELFLGTVAIITRIFCDAGQSMAGQLAKNTDCNCPKCQERRAKKKESGDVLEDFSVVGKYKN